MRRIPVAGPSITQKEIDYVADAAANAWYENAGTYNQRFEEAFAAYIGTRYAVSLPSCTAAIHLALAALGVGPGDEVIVPECTWIATAAPISYVGATPVFVDIDPVTWCIDVESLRQAISPRTRAIIPVDLYGNMPDYDALLRCAREHGITVIEDAAEAIGSTYRSRPAGSLGDVGVFSFHGSKTLTTGEGGMLVTNDDAIFERVQFLRDHGRAPGDRMFFNREIAFKYKMSSLQAALGLAQLERIDELVSRKREIFRWYEDALRRNPEMQLNTPGDAVDSSYWMVTVVLPEKRPETREDVRARLAASGIDTRPFFHPLSAIPAYSCMGPYERNSVSRQISERGINLPSGLNILQDDVGVVAEALLAISK